MGSAVGAFKHHAHETEKALAMKRTILLPLFATVVISGQAQLAPKQVAPLSAHMIEVNAQWRIKDNTSLDEHMVSFANENERIATHLRMVCDQLVANMPEGLSAAQHGLRLQLVETLRAYADRGVFPQNHALPYRNPVFIDPHNTACAVGHLMRESGNGALAQRIHDEMNLAYVLDIPLPEVGAWGSEHGFTADELAWIQPGYPATDRWIAFGGGTNAPVTTLLKLSNGDLLVAGEFTQAGGSNHMHVARWDGSAYQPLGNGVEGTIECAIEQAGVIMVGGTFQNGNADAAIWNGATWTYTSVFPGMSPAVHAFHIHNNELYAAGTESGFAGTDHRVSKLVGMAWQYVGGNMNNTIHALASYNNELVMGGAFTGLSSFGNPDSSVMHVARYDGNAWLQYADGLNATVRDLELFDGQLHAGGDLYENIAPVFGLARIAVGATTWEQLMPNLTLYFFPGAGPTHLSCLFATDTALYLGGSFSLASGLSYGSNIAVFHGLVDGFTPTATFDAPVRALAMVGTRLVAGGDMLTANGDQVDHIAELELATGIDEVPGSIEMSLWPNPAHTSVSVSLGKTLSPDAHYDVTDATGRVVISERVITERFAIDAGALATGVYTLRVGDGARTGTMTFVKE